MRTVNPPRHRVSAAHGRTLAASSVPVTGSLGATVELVDESGNELVDDVLGSTVEGVVEESEGVVPGVEEVVAGSDEDVVSTTVVVEAGTVVEVDVVGRVVDATEVEVVVVDVDVVTTGTVVLVVVVLVVVDDVVDG